MTYIYYWFVDDESGEDFFVEVKSSNARGDVKSAIDAWQTAKNDFGDKVRLIDIVDEKLAGYYGFDIY